MLDANKILTNVDITDFNSIANGMNLIIQNIEQSNSRSIPHSYYQAYQWLQKAAKDLLEAQMQDIEQLGDVFPYDSCNKIIQEKKEELQKELYVPYSSTGVETKQSKDSTESKSSSKCCLLV